MSYVDEIYERVVAQNPGEPEFHQAVKEVLDSLKLVIDANEEKYRMEGILERFTEPERIVSFRVPWVDDNGAVQVNKGYRIQFNSAIGPYKGCVSRAIWTPWSAGPWNWGCRQSRQFITPPLPRQGG